MALFHTTVVDNQIKALDTIGTSSGSIATFDTDKAERLVNLEVAIVATQSGSGTPSPSNPRAINGWSDCLLAQSEKSTVLATGSKLNINSVGEVINVTQNFQYVIARVKQGETYTYSINGTIATSCPVIAFFTDYPKVGSVSYNGSRSVEEFATFTAPIDGYAMVRGGNTYDEVNMMISVGSSVSEYEQPTTETISFGQTVYGGRLNVGSGVLTVTHGIITDLGALSWTKGSKSFYADITGAKLYAHSVIPNMLCEIYRAVSYNDLVSEQYNEVCSIDRNLSIILIRDTNYATASDFTTAVTGKKAIYELSTPLIIQLDSKQIQSIIGTNNIYADTGDIIDLKFVLTVGQLIS